MNLLRQFAALFVSLCLAFAPQQALAVLKAVQTVGPPSNALITGGTLMGAALNGPPVQILLKGGIPLISLSSGSIAANGAISGITALPTTYPQAYCYFPANAVAIVAAAGYRYCTFSSTTVGVAFLDTLPATGPATIPASPTAVTDGKGAFTGDTGEEFGVTVSVPILVAKDVIRVYAAALVNNNANVKTLRVRLSGNAGTVFFSNALASLGNGSFIGEIANAGTAIQTSQVFAVASGSVTAGTSGTINTAVATTLVFSLQKATATDNIVMYPSIVELLSDGT